jgi:hypothetical protein
MPRVTVNGTLFPIPQLTRLVTADGLAVRVFVVRVVPTRVVPPAAAAARRVRRFEASLRRYELLGRLPGAGRGPYALFAAQQLTAFPAPGHRIFSLVPARVTAVRWSWPRLFNPRTLNYDPPTTLTARVHNNLAIAATSEAEPPSIGVWYNAAGRAVRRLTNPDAVGAQFGPGRSTPGPETALTRAAERDPSTPNRVVAIPAPSIPAPQPARARAFLVLFHVLIQHAEYGVRVTGGPHPGCVRPPAYGRGTSLPGPPAPRGGTFRGLLSLAGSCPGDYTISAYVRGPHGVNHRAFGSAAITIP